MAIAHDIAAQLARALQAGGMSGEYFRPEDDATGPGTPVRFMLRHPGLRDDAIVNAYGVNAQIITLAHVVPFTTREPQKFDVIVQSGSLRYVFDAVVLRAMGDVVIGWTAYVRGKGA